MLIKIAKTVIAFQPLFAVPVYFSVLTGSPPLLLSLLIAIIPTAVNLRLTGRLFPKSAFGMPILIFSLGSLVGIFVATDKGIAVGALASTFASILVYYGIVSNSSAGRRYWQWTAGIVCFIAFTLSLWFLSQSDRRVLPFNQWAFNLFAGFPKTNGPVMQEHTIGALLAVVIPPLFVFIFFKYRKSIRIAALGLCFFFILMLFLSDSGTGWLAATSAIIFIVVFRQKRLLWLIVPTGGLITFLAAHFYDKTDWLKVTFSTGSLMGRIDAWKNTLPLLDDKAAFFGLGPGQWLNVYSSHYANAPAHVHNSYLQLYCDAGALGLAAMVLAAIIFVRLSWKILHSPREKTLTWIGTGLIAAIIAGAVFAMFDVTYSVTYVKSAGYIYLGLPLIWIFAALFAVVDIRLNKARTGSRTEDDSKNETNG
jgi:O-antigen ligase